MAVQIGQQNLRRRAFLGPGCETIPLLVGGESMAGTRRIRLCREGVYYLIMLVALVGGALSRQLNLLMLLGCLLSGPFLFSLVYGRLALRKLVVARVLPPALRADQHLVVDVSVINKRRWLGVWAIEARDSLTHEGEQQQPATEVSVFFPRIAARDSNQIAYQGRVPRRGSYQFGPLRLATRFPLGLVEHSVETEQTESLIVHPRLGRLLHEWYHGTRESVAGNQQKMQRRGAVEADFYGLRDWRPGDNRRWIHWRTSARRGSLVVRQFEVRRSEALAILVDLWQPEHPSPAELERVETCVSFVATLIAEACRQSGRSVLLHVAAQEPLVRSGPATPLYFREQMDALAVISAHHDRAFPRELGHQVALLPLATRIVVVGTRELDAEAFKQSAEERGAQLAGRSWQAVNVGREDLGRYFRM